VALDIYGSARDHFEGRTVAHRGCRDLEPARDLRPLRRAWRAYPSWLDERAMDQMRRFGASFGAEKIHAISGKPVGASEGGKKEVLGARTGKRLQARHHLMGE
jgi:hypothetical protein